MFFFKVNDWGYQMKKTIVLCIFISFLLVLSSCNKMKEEEYHVMRLSPPDTQIEDNYCIVEYGTVTESVKLRVNLVSSEESSLCFQTSGVKFDRFYAKEGDVVKKGQLLARLDCKDYIDERNTTIYEIQRIEIRLQELNNLYLQNCFTEKEYQKENKQLLSQKKICQQKVDELNRYIDERSIYADIDGVIRSFADINYNTVSNTANVIYKIYGGDFYYSAKVSDESGLIPGQIYNIVIDNINYSVELKDITPNQTNNYTVLFCAPTGNNDLNRFGEVSYVVKERENVLYIEAKAVVKVNDEYYVYFRTEDGTLNAKAIEIDEQVGKYYVIKEGLKEGDEIICN